MIANCRSIAAADIVLYLKGCGTCTTDYMEEDLLGGVPVTYAPGLTHTFALSGAIIGQTRDFFIRAEVSPGRQAFDTYSLKAYADFCSSGTAPTFDNLPAAVEVQNDNADGTLFTVVYSDVNTLDKVTLSLLNIAPTTTKFTLDVTTGRLCNCQTIHFISQYHELRTKGSFHRFVLSSCMECMN